MTQIEPQGYLSLTPAISLQITLNEANEEVRWRYMTTQSQTEWVASPVLYDGFDRPYFETDSDSHWLHEFYVD